MIANDLTFIYDRIMKDYPKIQNLHIFSEKGFSWIFQFYLEGEKFYLEYPIYASSRKILQHPYDEIDKRLLSNEND